MNKIYIGKVVNTHGIKGEIRILSNFEYKDKVFKVNNKFNCCKYNTNFNKLY